MKKFKCWLAFLVEILPIQVDHYGFKNRVAPTCVLWQCVFCLMSECLQLLCFQVVLLFSYLVSAESSDLFIIPFSFLSYILSNAISILCVCVSTRMNPVSVLPALLLAIGICTYCVILMQPIDFLS